MTTVFSYIVQRRLSQENENVATEALAFILESSERGRSALVKLLRGIAPDLPPLRFRIQQTQGSARPDMWGFDAGTARVFIENKFWAGLTDNQPLEYLRLLAEYPNPAVLLMIVPEARLETVWRDLRRRLEVPAVSVTYRQGSAGVPYVATVNLGASLATPMLAITSWAHVLRTIEEELADEPQRRNDLLQLRALCHAADDYMSAPFSSTELTNQRTPALFLQLSAVVQRAVDAAVARGVLSVKGLMPMSNWERSGRYISFPQLGIGAWIGTDFRRWREHGGTPLWLVFGAGTFGRALEVRAVLETWAERQGLPSSMKDNDFSVGIDLIPGEEQEYVVNSIVRRLVEIATELSRLSPTVDPNAVTNAPS
jgi:hypothetical protein